MGLLVVVGVSVSASRPGPRAGREPPLAELSMEVGLPDYASSLRRLEAFLQVAVEEQYRTLCAPCHGAEGEGDGVAAIALNPKPRNFTASDFLDQFSEADISSAILNGKGSMPAWRQILTGSEIERMVQYVIRLSRGS